MSEQKTNKQAARIFRKAAAYIRTYGWQEIGMSSHGQARCSMGALASAHPANTWDSTLSRFMYSTLYRELDGLTLTEFNARAGQDGTKVASLFEHIANKITKQRLC